MQNANASMHTNIVADIMYRQHNLFQKKRSKFYGFCAIRIFFSISTSNRANGEHCSKRSEYGQVLLSSTKFASNQPEHTTNNLSVWQVVWSQTNLLGCGYARCHDVWGVLGRGHHHVFVCHYHPQGNTVLITNSGFYAVCSIYQILHSKMLSL